MIKTMKALFLRRSASFALALTIHESHLFASLGQLRAGPYHLGKLGSAPGKASTCA